MGRKTGKRLESCKLNQAYIPESRLSLTLYYFSSMCLLQLFNMYQEYSIYTWNFISTKRLYLIPRPCNVIIYPSTHKEALVSTNITQDQYTRDLVTQATSLANLLYI